MSVEEPASPEEDETETQSMDALAWLLMHEGTLSEAAASYGIGADTSDEELEGMAWMGVRAAYDEDFNVDEDSLLSALKLARQAAGDSSTLLTPDDHTRAN